METESRSQLGQNIIISQNLMKTTHMPLTTIHTLKEMANINTKHKHSTPQVFSFFFKYIKIAHIAGFLILFSYLFFAAPVSARIRGTAPMSPIQKATSKVHSSP